MKLSLSKKGFTLIELLIVIVVLGVLATVVMIAINPLGMINSANLAKVKTFSASVENLLSIAQVGKWSFESVDANSKTPDTSGYGNNGSLSGAGSSIETETNCGLGFGKCLKLTGSTDFMSVPDPSNGSLDLKAGEDLTVSLWFNFENDSQFFSSTNTVVLHKRNGEVFYRIQTGPTGLGCAIKGVPSERQQDIFLSKDKFKAGNWHHLVMTVDTNNHAGFKVYLNGKLEATQDPTGSENDSIDTNTPLEMGKFAGKIDEVQIYKQALALSQIQQLYAQGLSKHQLVYNK